MKTSMNTTTYHFSTYYFAMFEEERLPSVWVRTAVIYSLGSLSIVAPMLSVTVENL